MLPASHDSVPSEERKDRMGLSYVLQMILVALIALAIQIALMAFAWHRWPVDYRFAISQTSRPFAMPIPSSVSPVSAAIWDGKIWVAATSNLPMYPGSPSVRAASSQLTTIDLSTGESHQTAIALNPAPLGLLTVDGQLWAVTELVAFLIDETQAIPRYPRRGLNHPSRPFLYQNQLAVIDKNKSDVYSLLTWNDGEWTDIGKIDVPMIPNGSRWLLDELRVVSDEHSTYLFFSDGATITYREGIEVVSDSEPASALRPQNLIGHPEWDPSATGIWKSTPFSTGWGTVWDVALIDGELFAVSASSASTTVILNVNRQGTWRPVSGANGLPTGSFSLIAGTPGYLVDNNLNLYTLDSVNGFRLIQANAQSPEKFRWPLQFLTVLIPYLLGTGLLVWRAELLVQRHRNASYLYGKRYVTFAPLGRRAIARGIDTMITVFPPAFWFLIAVAEGPNIKLPYRILGQPTVQFVVFLSIFGTWLGAILILGFLEGRNGLTPGKWLCGIRTFRTTLRPCGMLRAVTRELLIYIDSVALMVWLPGVLVIAFTKDWQRIGDLVAETVVVLDRVSPQVDSAC